MIINIFKIRAMKYLLDREPPPGESAGRKSQYPSYIRNRIDTAFRHSFKWIVNATIPIVIEADSAADCTGDTQLCS